MNLDMFLTLLASMYSTAVMILISALVDEGGVKILEMFKDEEYNDEDF
jgi:hypothetical protein